MWRVVREESRVLSGEEIAFEVGSICRGRRVNVSSIVVVVVVVVERRKVEAEAPPRGREAGVKPAGASRAMVEDPSSAEYVSTVRPK